MLRPSQVLDVLSKGSAYLKKSPFYANYRRKLETPTSFHLHKDILTDLPSRPQVKRQEVHALRILQESRRLNSPRLSSPQRFSSHRSTPFQASFIRASSTSPVRTHLPSLRQTWR
jgi:hypothetical protein